MQRCGESLATTCHHATNHHKPNTAGTQGVSHGRRSDSGDSVHVAAGKSLGTSGSRGGQVATGTFSLGVDYIDIVFKKMYIII